MREKCCDGVADLFQIGLSASLILFNKHIFSNLNFAYVSSDPLELILELMSTSPFS